MKSKKTIILIISLLLIVTLSLLSVFIFKPFSNTNNPDNNETTQDEKVSVTPSKKLINIPNIQNFLNLYQQESINLAESAEARIRFVEIVMLGGNEDSEEDDVRYVEESKFQENYEKTFGIFYSYQSDIENTKSDFYRTCTKKSNPNCICWNDTTPSEDIFFEIANTDKSITDSNYEITGNYSLYQGEKITQNNYYIQYENGYLKNLILPYSEY